MRLYNYRVDDLNIFANQNKEIFLEAMVKEGLINKNQKDLMNNYSMLTVEKGVLGKLWDKILFKYDKHPSITVVKIIT